MLQETENDFFKARNKALMNEIQHFLKPEEAYMISFKEIKELIKPQNETYLGMKVIPVAKIIGSEGRYNDFDNQFFPKSIYLKERWAHVDEAASHKGLRARRVVFCAGRQSPRFRCKGERCRYD